MSHNIQSVGGRPGREPREGRLSEKEGPWAPEHQSGPRAAALVTHAGVDAGLQPGAAGASSPADQGVTAKTITVGLPYVNFAALKSLGVTINDGSFPDAYSRVIANINAKGGVNGRKLVLTTVEMNPSVPADGDLVVHPAHRGRQGLRRHRAGLPGLLPADPRHAGAHGVVARNVAGHVRARLLARPARREL